MDRNTVLCSFLPDDDDGYDFGALTFYGRSSFITWVGPEFDFYHGDTHRYLGVFGYFSYLMFSLGD